jgi:hypothetical protein
MIQLITPTPWIQCAPGWCLQYVRQTFGLPARYGTATEAWEKSDSKHLDMDFPPGVWLPLWFSLEHEPAGHVVLRAPDGSIYSTSSPTGTTPTHHPNLADLFVAYSRYNPLTYLGWTEDVAGYPVVAGQGTITTQSTPTQEDFMGGQIDAVQAESMVQETVNRVIAALNGRLVINPQQAEDIVQATTGRVVSVLKDQPIDRQQADDIARAAARYNQERDAALYTQDNPHG